MSFSLPLFGTGFVLILIQLLAAAPWLIVFNWSSLRAAAGPTLLVRVAVIGLAGAVLVPAGLSLGLIQDRASLEMAGRLYGSVLHLQLFADLLVGIFWLMLLIWPKGGAVALAAFREGVRQPMFWLLTLLAVGLMSVSPFIPYFTFGEDYVVVQELGYDTIMLACVVLGVLAASMSISEEIEGKTAITLMSKPVSRRQFLLGKFTGILLVTVLLTGVLGWYFQWIQICKQWFDRMDAPPTPVVVANMLDYLRLSPQSEAVVRGVGLWAVETYQTLGGLALGLCQVMVLLAIAVSLATRLPMVANLVVCYLIYLVGHLTPVLGQIAERLKGEHPGAPAGEMVSFTSKIFDIGLPGLEFFTLGPALTMDAPLPTWAFIQYVGTVCLYALVYTSIALLFGLVLFEDRDLA
jgi:ABC-type transport system involved in multi-copper enzyme maturation permease subunit